MKFSVIVPTLDEASECPAALASVDSEGPDREIIIADGGSNDGTIGILPDGVRVVSSAPGRARQMNAAAESATGDVLLFLHADCRLPPGALGTAALSLEDPAVVGGGFHKRFQSDAWLLRAPRLRTSLWFRLGALFGDQAIFVRRTVFDELGGFSADAETEDLEFVLRLRRRGRVVLLPPEISVSARRLDRDGILRTWARWWAVSWRVRRRSQ